MARPERRVQAALNALMSEALLVQASHITRTELPLLRQDVRSPSCSGESCLRPFIRYSGYEAELVNPEGLGKKITRGLRIVRIWEGRGGNHQTSAGLNTANPGQRMGMCGA